MNFLYLKPLSFATVLLLFIESNIFGAVFKPIPTGSTVTFSNNSETGGWRDTSKWSLVSGGPAAYNYPSEGDEVQFGNPGHETGLVINFNLAANYPSIILSSNSDGSELTIGSDGVVTASALNVSDRVTITVNSGGAFTVTSAVSITNTNSIIDNGGTLRLQAGLTLPGGGAKTFNNSGDTYITGDFTMSATDVNITAGSFNVTGSWVIPNAEGNGNNAVEVASGASMSIGGSVNFDNQAITGDLSTKIQISGTFEANGCNDNGSSVCDEIESQGGDLPVVLIALFGVQTDEGYLIKWTTASEQNNSHFIIEGAHSIGQWKEIVSIEGQGNSNTPTDYEIVLKREQYRHYRLVQYDFDGSFEIFGTLTQEISSTNRTVQIIPNEINQGQFVNLLFSNIDSDIPITLQLFDLIGNVLDYQSLSRTASSVYLYKIPSSSRCGYYVLSVLVGNKRYHQKILVK
ncbi:hypothetical protein [Flammeovirga sp. SJP92]|uniref:hypothetical protein n=1 Tax=Flammeovirga sp. SJP92 TaxID=1775430 RepID=UPI000787945B|nr:hypothetical protein [Flammeovirga sp. SJP92]KXX72381.1 hypothetical protein AVL50_01915 [Flammeovirga sp. SJP92]